MSEAVVRAEAAAEAVAADDAQGRTEKLALAKSVQAIIDKGGDPAAALAEVSKAVQAFVSPVTREQAFADLAILAHADYETQNDLHNLRMKKLDALQASNAECPADLSSLDAVKE